MSNGAPTPEDLARLIATADQLGERVPAAPATEAEEEALTTIRAARRGDAVDARQVLHAQGYLDSIVNRG